MITHYSSVACVSLPEAAIADLGLDPPMDENDQSPLDSPSSQSLKFNDEFSRYLLKRFIHT